MNNMKTKHFFLATLSILLGVGLSIYFVININSFSDGPNATNGLGQFDETGYPNPNPLYTSSRVNNLPNLFSFTGSYGQVVDSVNHRLFVSDSANNRILVFDLTAGDLLVDHVPDNVLGQSNFYTNTINTTESGLNNPSNLVFDSVNNLLYVSDSSNNRIMIFNVAEITNGETAINVLGQSDFVSSGNNATAWGLSSPKGLSLDDTNNLLYVSDSANHRVLVFDVASITNGEDATKLLGQYDETDYSNLTSLYTSNRANNSPNRLGFNTPKGVAIGGGFLFLADSSNNRILVYNLDVHNSFSSTDRIPDYVLGQSNYYTNNSGTSISSLNNPTRLTFDYLNSRLFVSDTGNNRILAYDLSDGITDGEDAMAVLGQVDFVSNNSNLSQSGINYPEGILFSENFLYVADVYNNRVLVFDVASITNGEDATKVLGQSDFVSSNYTTTVNGMASPKGVSIDYATGRLFVADADNNRVLVFDVNTITDGEDAVNVLGQPDFISNSGDITQSTMNHPHDVAYFGDGANGADNDGTLFVSEKNNSRITQYNVNTITDGENAVHVLGQSNFTSQNLDVDQNGIYTPEGIAVSLPENAGVFVTDSSLHRMLQFAAQDEMVNGMDAGDAIGQYDQTSVSSPYPIYTTQRIDDAPNRLGLSNPTGQVIDTINHRLFVLDTGNHRVLVYDLSITNELEDLVPDNVLGQSNFYSNTVATTINGFSNPNALLLDGNNRLFVSDSDNNRIMVFDTTAITDGENAVKVLGQTDFTTSTGNTSQSKLISPQSLAFDEVNDYLFVGDYNNNRIMIFDTTTITNGENAVDLIGKYDGTNFTDPVPFYFSSTDTPNAIGLDQPVDIAMDHTNHRLFVVDNGNHRVLVYNLTSDDLLMDRIPDYVLGQPNFNSRETTTTQSGLNHPTMLAFDDVNNRLFVSDTTNSRVMVFDTTTIVNGENAVNVLGQPNFTNALNGVTQSRMYYPYGLSFDSTNNRLFVSDTYNHRVLTFDVATITDGENAVNVIGQNNFTTRTTGNTVAKFNTTFGVLYDNTNHKLYVADGNNHRVMVFDVATITDGENAVNVLGQSNFTTGSSGLTQSKFNLPFGLALRSSDNTLFVSDVANHRVLTFDVSTIIDGENAVKVLGKGNFTTGSPTLSQSGIGNPNGLRYDSVHDYLYEADAGHHRIMVFDVSETVGGGGGGGGGGGQQPGINVVHTEGGTMVSENTTDTFTISLKSNITSDVVLSITSSNTNEGTVSPATITFSNNNWNTPQTITLTGISDGVVDGNQSYNIIISVIDELSATSYDGVADVIFSVSTTDSDTSNPNIPPNTPDNPIPTPPTNPPNTPSGNPSVPNTPTTPNNNPTTPNGGSGNNPSNPNTPPNNPNIPSGNNPNQNPNNNPSSENQNENSGVNTGKGIFEIISDILGSAITKTLVILGAASTIALNLVRLVFTNPLGITDLAMRAWSMFLYGFGIKKRHKPWGVVFDSQTKQPLDPVYLKLVDIEKKTLATCFTDIDGRYGFLVEPGHYHIIAEKTHYVFPSSKLNSRDRDEVYTDLYYGNYIEIKEFGEVISKNIPMDRIGFDWNEYAKLEQHRLRWYKRSDKAVGQIVDIFFLVGFIVSGITLLGSQIKDYNVIIFALYGILFAFNHTEFGNNAKGKAMFKIGAPIAYGILRVFSKQSGTEITHKIIDRLGNYFCLAPNGNYNISIEQKNADGSYTKVHSEEGIQITKGYLKKDFKV